jgi:hypothetical protein
MRPPTHYLLLVGLFLAAYLTTSAAVRVLNPWSEAEGLRTKLGVFDAHRDEYDALYLGSSHVYHAFQPEVIDPVVSQAVPGLSSFRSFNLGMEGMFSFETDALLREVLARRSNRLKWLVIEAPSWRAKLSKAGLDTVTERNARWHDPITTLHALQSLFLSNREPQEGSVYASAAVHLRLLGLWLGNHGRGPEIFRALDSEPTAEERMQRDEFLARRGYQALEQREGEIFELRKRNFLVKARNLPDRVARLGSLLEKRAAEDLPPSGYNHAALARQLRLIRAAELEVVYVTLPALSAPRYFGKLARNGSLPNYIDLLDPKRYPELWTVEHRYDEGHLSREGAEILSRIFAQQFARLVGDSADPEAR